AQLVEPFSVAAHAGAGVAAFGETHRPPRGGLTAREAGLAGALGRAPRVGGIAGHAPLGADPHPVGAGHAQAAVALIAAGAGGAEIGGPGVADGGTRVVAGAAV